MGWMACESDDDPWPAAESEPALIEVERNARLDADAELFDMLWDAGFEGPVWELFAQEMCRYAIPVLLAWMSSGHIFTVVRSKIPLRPSEQEIRRFATDGELRDGMADTAVAVALHRFKQRSRKNQSWSRTGAASLTTYFVNGCVYAFAEEFKKYRGVEERRRLSDLAAIQEELARPIQGRYCEDFAQRVVDDAVVTELMDTLAPRDRNIVWGKASQMTNNEIAQMFGEKSGRAVEDRWSWLRKQHMWIARLGRETR
ncbi:hypothetical protein [Nocardia sp. NPDC051832]|uniref:hypothetical protein n=1 Tax=Nocardia sp. NPDC051832 TaxID=3155673 RepID=UPI00343C0A5A